MAVGNLNGQFALDLQGLQRLKRTAGSDPGQGLDEAAKQFEAIFMQMMLKSMRDAIPETGLLNSQQTQFYTEMLDKQWSQHLSGHGIGLAEQLINQLESRGLVPQGASATEDLIAGIPRGTPRVLHDGLRADEESEAVDKAPEKSEFGSLLSQELDLRPQNVQEGHSAPATSSANSGTAATRGERADHVTSFLDRLEAPAQAASRKTGVPAELILAQAALETGWGRHEIPTRDGGNSHNLFGIKAGSHWQGDTTDITTTEYVNGRATKQVDRFRVYDSFEDAFTDYARLIGDNPRYASVLTAPNAKAAAQELQAAGYATDPAYADKLVAVMNTFGERPASAVAQSGSAKPIGFGAGQVPASLF
ncbi:flagellar assembly peptidoglycan hydrolase FlgJ [Modicisalibacter luteus]|uniref:Peptidoglycan hydrolase FlgJ n=1 Tax=Modicisalibacter luteus TaxID=453962 RepID=A0ABV7M2J8_9GAMM|nr:flagellar assembly peptidoglycan hydrolase FlgJ [Halomonas lutea]GHA84252.1 flagellar rod assembly protein FlgJ [Halomonas lutea]